MRPIETEIIRSINENAIAGVDILHSHELNEIVNNITAKYSDCNSSTWALWEHLTHKISFQDVDGWETIPKLIGNSDCILFVLTEKFAVHLPNGYVLDTILRDTFQFVFYVTNSTLDYLLCFNDHDFVIGCGIAEKWIIDYYGHDSVSC